MASRLPEVIPVTFAARTGLLIICYHCRAQAYQHIDCEYRVEYGLCHVCVATLRKQGALHFTCNHIYNLNNPDAHRRLPGDYTMQRYTVETHCDTMILDTRQVIRLTRAHWLYGLTIGLLIGGIACHIVVMGALLFR